MGGGVRNMTHGDSIDVDLKGLQTSKPFKGTWQTHQLGTFTTGGTLNMDVSGIWKVPTAYCYYSQQELSPVQSKGLGQPCDCQY